VGGSAAAMPDCVAALQPHGRPAGAFQPLRSARADSLSLEGEPTGPSRRIRLVLFYTGTAWRVAQVGHLA
jgi:hypothetical protein